MHSNGGFRCLADVQQGPLKGCLQGQGIRWDTDGLLAEHALQVHRRGDRAREDRRDRRAHRRPPSDFYRAGDGNDASFKSVQVIVSDHDLAPDIAGVQNVWIQQVGCGTANVNFSS